MRIVAGKFKGHGITAPSGTLTRPTTDRVRESMFSSLYSRLPDLNGVSVLDAFAGSGALGIEALSRGAATCLFFERDARAREVLKENLASLDLPRSHAVVRAADVFVAAAHPLRVNAAFGLVLLDPPYALAPEQIETLLTRLAAQDDLASEAVVVYEHASERAAEVADVFSSSGSLALTGQRRYGKIGVSCLQCVLS
jgi:16S rRNA (guanine966-N2)-methyltransferase